MFNLFVGNDATRLADELGERLRAQTREHPLTPTLVLVPHQGLKRWLQVHLAERLGVIANVAFRAPAEFAWDLLRAARPDLPRRSPFEPDVLRWHLHALLGESFDGAALAPLRDYLSGDGDPLRRYALSGELAHVFERMQGYRRERLLAWERGADADDWQAELWRRLVKRVGGASRASRMQEWLRRYDLADAQHAPPDLPQHLSAFACANISPDVLRMLGVASRHCDLDFFLPLPSKEYLGDLPRSRREVRERLTESTDENPLVLSMGTAAREFFELLYEYGCVHPGGEIDKFDSDIDRDTLLGRVRDDILKHQAARENERVAQPDDSLQFHACHTPLREVQTLHDALLAMFEDARFDPPLQPRDIAVMMPDVAAYRPAIEAVFGGLSENDPRFVPYNLGDIGAAATHPAAQLFLQLLDARGSRWEATEILDVLSVPGVMRRFDLDAASLEHLSRQVRESGVRWGEDESARVDCGSYREFSFAFGIDRMLAGFACGDDEETLVGGVAPLAGIEGAAFARIDALLGVLDAWRRLRALSWRELRAAEWQRALNALFEDVYAPDANDVAETRALERVRGALEQWVEDTEAAQFDRAITWDNLRAFLRERLNDADPRQQLFSGGVTFCGMVPLRVVPFRVICLLGMNADAFPRRDSGGLDPLLADRRAGHAQRGDRNVRDDDRLLFLQLLAAARDTLYISWIGRDAHSNEMLPPSAVVAELMDDVKQNYLLETRHDGSREMREGYLFDPADDAARDARNALLPQVQPLNPFDPRLFGANGEPSRSYRQEWMPAASASDAVAAPAVFASAMLAHNDNKPNTDLTLEELRRFLLEPARGFLERGLGLALPRARREDDDDEPLAPGNGLIRWNLTRALLDRGEHNAAITRDILRARGRLPPGALGDESLRDAQVRADGLRAAVLAFTGGTVPLMVESRRVKLDDGTHLQGAPAELYPAGVLHVRPGLIDGRHVLRAWLDALFCAASGEDKTVVLIGLDGHDASSFALPRLATEPACALLHEWVQLFRQGVRAPLPLFPRISWEHALHCAALETQANKKGVAATFDLRVFNAAAKHSDSDNGYGAPNEFDDEAVCIAWRGRDLSGSSDRELAGRLHEVASEFFALPARAWKEQFK